MLNIVAIKVQFPWEWQQEQIVEYCDHKGTVYWELQQWQNVDYCDHKGAVCLRMTPIMECFILWPKGYKFLKNGKNNGMFGSGTIRAQFFLIMSTLM